MAFEVLVVQTSTANTASVVAGLNRVNAQPVLTKDPDLIRYADRVVLPGVGTFSAAINQLQTDGLIEALIERIEEARPTLAICLGLQMLCNGSEESPGTAGLGILPTQVFGYPNTMRVPQMGWNEIIPDSSCRYLKRGYAYFANSYYLATQPPSWNAAWSDYEIPFVAAVEKDDVLACQFHPELSGLWGTDLLERWLNRRPKGGLIC